MRSACKLRRRGGGVAGRTATKSLSLSFSRFRNCTVLPSATEHLHLQACCLEFIQQTFAELLLGTRHSVSTVLSERHSVSWWGAEEGSEVWPVSSSSLVPHVPEHHGEDP